MLNSTMLGNPLTVSCSYFSLTWVIVKVRWHSFIQQTLCANSVPETLPGATDVATNIPAFTELPIW